MQAPIAAAGVVAYSRERILSGRLLPGATLPLERTRASELAVSRVTLREGLSTLAPMGPVTIRRGRSGGTLMTAPAASTVSSSMALLSRTRSEMAGQLAGFRCAQEPGSARLAALHHTETGLEVMTAALAGYAGAVGARVQSEQGRAFHRAIARASGNQLLADTMAARSASFAEALEMAPHQAPDAPGVILALHRPILAAICAQDAAAARQHRHTHFDHLFAVFAAPGLSGHAPALSARPRHTRAGTPSGAERR